MPLKTNSDEKGKILAEAHWSYIEALLMEYCAVISETEKFNYISAFVHGYKHGQADK